MSIVSGTTAAIMGSKATRQAADTAAGASRDSTASQERLQNRVINQNQPMTDASNEALAYLKSAVLGGNQSVRALKYDSNGQQILDADGKPAYDTYSGTFTPGESPAAKWQLEQGTKNMNRNLAARGLLGSGNAATRLSDLQNGINAQDWDKQYGRLLDLTAKGSGAAASTQSAANALGGAYQQQGNANAAAALQSGQAQASLYSGLGGVTSNAASTGIKAYQSGMFNNLGGSTASTTLAADAVPSAGAAGYTWSAGDLAALA